MQFGQLPPTMYLQMDNCWRENKNRYVFCFLALLVELGIFEKVSKCVIVIIIRCVFTRYQFKGLTLRMRFRVREEIAD